MPVSRTRSAQARRAQTWRHRHRRISLAWAPHCHCPQPFLSGPAAPPSTTRPLARRRRRWLPASWLLGRCMGFCPLSPAHVRPHLVCPQTLWSLRGFCPLRAPRPPQGCRRLEETRLTGPLRDVPPGSFPHSGGLAAPVVIPHSQGFFAHISCRPPFFSPCSGLSSCQPHATSLLAAPEGAFPVSLLPVLALPYTSPTPLSCVPHGDAVSVFPLSSGSPAVIPSSSVSDPAKSPAFPPLNPLLTLSISPRPSL